MNTKEPINLSDTNILKSTSISPDVMRDGSYQVKKMLQEGLEISEVLRYLHSLSIDEFVLVLRDLCIDVPSNTEIKQGIFSLARVSDQFNIIRMEASGNDNQ